MGQKSSRNKETKNNKPTPEVTEIYDLHDNQTSSFFDEEDSPQVAANASGPSAEEVTVFSSTVPAEFIAIMSQIQEVERKVDQMSASHINLYYMTFKDDLHNNWQKIYGMRRCDKDVKIEAIDRIKRIIERLNNRVLNKQN